MSDTQPIRLLEATPGPEDRAPEGFVRRRLDLPVRDDILTIAADVPQRDMPLAEIVPLTYAIDDRLVALYLRQAAEAGKPVHCGPGCAACCSNYLPVLSPAEMYHLPAKLDLLDAPSRQGARAWLARMAEDARATGLIATLRACGPSDAPLDIVRDWWLHRDDHTCPFLAADRCAIYPLRFICCREHLSHSPPRACAQRDAAVMPLPVNLANALWQLEAELTGQPAGALSLPLLDLWAEVRADEAGRTFAAVEMVDRLVGILARAAAEAGTWRGGTPSARPQA